MVEKPAGLLTVPTPSRRDPDLVSLLRETFRDQGVVDKVYAAHRLDRGVSGLLVMARSREVLETLITAFKARRVERTYLAMVRGLVREDEGSFRNHLALNRGTLRMHAAHPSKGKRAVTHYRVLARFTPSRATLVEVTLETGVKNQIRVHFADAGHPVLGERKYLSEGQKGASSVQGLRRIFLHASTLEFPHPHTGRASRWTAELPGELERWKERLEQGQTLEDAAPRRGRGPFPKKGRGRRS